MEESRPNPRFILFKIVKPVVGSSRNITLGSEISSEPIKVRFFSPPEIPLWIVNYKKKLLKQKRKKESIYTEYKCCRCRCLRILTSQGIEEVIQPKKEKVNFFPFLLKSLRIFLRKKIWSFFTFFFLSESEMESFILATNRKASFFSHQKTKEIWTPWCSSG